mmetsp:Transcript_14888/g.32331  ORF Transcript_14888/g.32331 Transcript_14888/m.32331 type:complete len:207 (-) Transcript_14888:929-1549(-)
MYTVDSVQYKLRFDLLFPIVSQYLTTSYGKCINNCILPFQIQSFSPSTRIPLAEPFHQVIIRRYLCPILQLSLGKSVGINTARNDAPWNVLGHCKLDDFAGSLIGVEAYHEMTFLENASCFCWIDYCFGFCVCFFVIDAVFSVTSRLLCCCGVTIVSIFLVVRCPIFMLQTFRSPYNTFRSLHFISELHISTFNLTTFLGIHKFQE